MFDQHSLARRDSRGGRLRAPGLAARLGVAAFAITLVISMWGVWSISDDSREHARAHFEQRVHRIEAGVQRRMAGATLVLRAASSLFVASDRVTPEEFAAAMSVFLCDNSSPGMVRIAHVPNHPSAGLGGEAWIVAPDASGTRTLLYDETIGPAERQTVEEAWRTGAVVLSQPLNFAPEGEPRIPGVAMAMPVSTETHPGVDALATSPGVVVIWLRLDQLLADQALGDASGIDLEIFDGPELNAPSTLLDSDGHLLRHDGRSTPGAYADRLLVKHDQIELGGRTWTMVASSTESFDALFSAQRRQTLLGLSVVVSVLLGLVIWAMGTSRQRAIGIAQQMTADLAEASRLAHRTMREMSALRAGLDQHGIVSVADRRGRIIDASPGFCRISGYTLEELVGQDHRMVNSGEHPKAFWVEMWRTIAAGQTWRGEVCNRAKDGSLYWVDSTIVPLLGEDGVIDRFVSIRFDVTARKHAEHENARLAEVAKRTSNAVIVTDAQGLIEWVNDGFTRITGYFLDEVRGRTPGSILQGPDTDPVAAQRMGKAIRAGIGCVEELINYSKAGVPYLIRCEIVPMRDERGGLTGFMAIESDVTARRRIEAELRASEQKFRVLADSAPMLIWTKDTAGQCDYFNRSWLEYTGRTLEEEVGTGWTERIHPDDRAQAMETCRRSFEAQTPFEMEFRLLRADGVYRLFLDRGVPRYGPGGVLEGFIGACMDVTELRDATQRAEAADRAKSQFLANMSHEIRTPLTAILGYAEMLGEDEELVANAPLRAQTFQTIRAAGEHLRVIIDDVLDLSKIEAGQMLVESIEVDLPSVLSSVVRLLEPMVRDKGLTFAVAMETPIPARVMVDPTRLRQVFLNIASNAVKFTTHGGVELRIRHREENLLEIDITDTGAGIPPLALEGLFKPFTQADAGVTRTYGGTGLGLAISRKLARLMGGDVVLLRSEPGQGSTFRITTRADLAPATGWAHTLEAPTAPAPTPAASQTLEGLILLVEDGPDNQRLFSHILRRAGATVETAWNGQEALDAIDRLAGQGRTPDLVLTDLQMPTMDGYTLIQRLRDRGWAAPIAALTAHAREGEADRCTSIGADACLRKPIQRDQLIAACAQLMQRHSTQRAA